MIEIDSHPLLGDATVDLKLRFEIEELTPKMNLRAGTKIEILGCSQPKSEAAIFISF
jgi:hypothetical protein